jgi:hypothetical protein
MGTPTEVNKLIDALAHDVYNNPRVYGLAQAWRPAPTAQMPNAHSTPHVAERNHPAAFL